VSLNCCHPAFATWYSPRGPSPFVEAVVWHLYDDDIVLSGVVFTSVLFETRAQRLFRNSFWHSCAGVGLKLTGYDSPGSGWRFGV